MESVCEGCKKVYNQYERQRIQLNCGDNICLECFDLLLPPQDNKLICPNPECGETLIIKKRFKDNIQKMRENHKGLMIFCEKHQTLTASNFCKVHSTMQCDKCALQDHSDHKQALIEVKRQNVEDFCDNSIKLLISLKNRIDMALESLSTYKTNSKSFISDRIMALILETQNILLKSHLKNEKDKLMIQFPTLNQQLVVNQEEFKMNPQDEIKEQKPQANIKLISRQQIMRLQQQRQQPQEQKLPVFQQEFDEYSRKVFNLDSTKCGLLQKWIGRKVKFQLTYRATRDGFTLIDSKCLKDCKPNITIIKSEHDQIFGGYASDEWENGGNQSQGFYNPCKDSFLFQLTKETKHELNGSQQQAVYISASTMLGFGNYDLWITKGCNQNSDSSADYFGEYYKLPESMQYGSQEAQCYLAGSRKFKVKEIEIYKVID